MKITFELEIVNGSFKLTGRNESGQTFEKFCTESSMARVRNEIIKVFQNLLPVEFILKKEQVETIDHKDSEEIIVV